MAHIIGVAKQVGGGVRAPFLALPFPAFCVSLDGGTRILLAEPRIKSMQVDIGEQGRGYASYIVAKKLVEFELKEDIPRNRLRAAYGAGFKGAPLGCDP